MNFASIQKSDRLQRALSALQLAGKRGVTTREWILAADICACNSVAAELRANGYPVTCSFEGRSDRGASVFRYRLDMNSAQDKEPSNPLSRKENA